MDLSTFALVIITMAAIAFLVMAAFLAFVVIRYRPTIMGFFALLGGAAWVASPVDPIPEALFGPFGTVDDLAVLLTMALYVARLASRRRLTGNQGQPSWQSAPTPANTPETPVPPPTYHFGTPQTFGSTTQDE